ncbi:transglycosylase domain-containing protein [Caldalkalibacillus salinus]|uniref:transglycosylase domain-containing protein n=1 Tax=Caldalkalibacillus salinus TaxID=2803787 RepID=UPI0019223276|nr:PBP1A family penicillin-binding protein [Caldalkalibacillus salinus]
MSKNKKFKPNWKWIAIIGVSLAFLACLAVIGFMGLILTQNYHVDESKLENMRQATTLYDRKGEEVGKIFRENREYVPLEEMPDLLKEAFVAVEDRRFYEHSGVDFRSIARALYRDILARSAVEGGSTITQQLVKNVFLSSEKKLMRKTEEVLIAVNLEKRYTKDEILEMYLNYIFFGGHEKYGSAYGIAAAADMYFDKEVQDLELSEIAMLAALPKAPNSYAPVREENSERSEQRRQVVLNLMYDQGIITAEQRKEAAEAELDIAEPGDSGNPAYNTYIDMVIDEAKEKYDLTGEEILTGGYKIYTSMDAEAQQSMYDAFRTDGPHTDLFPEGANSEGVVQGGMVMLDHQSGAVSAVIGGRNNKRGDMNRATVNSAFQGRQPGSAFKPLAVYAPALELGWNPYDLVKDEPMDFGGYAPQNYDHRFHGDVTMMKAVEQSYNVPAVWLLNEIGINMGTEYVEAFGFDPAERELGMALGGGNVMVSPMQMARAYGAFANNGVMMEPYLIDRIEDRNGNVIVNNEMEFEQVISPQTAWYMTRMLKNVVDEGTGRRAQMAHDVAGKTGTTQDPNGSGNARDAWFVGYTPQYVTAVWLGKDDATPIISGGSQHPTRLFHHVMSQALDGQSPQQFVRPDGVDELVPPVRFEKMSDLQAILSMNNNFSVTVTLDFTPNSDERVGYKIYRMNGDDRELLADLRREELIEGRQWVDENVNIMNLPDYQVVPYDLTTGREGSPSNVAQVSMSRERGNDDDDDEYDEWLEDLEEEYLEEGKKKRKNEKKEETELTDEENRRNEEPSNEDGDDEDDQDEEASREDDQDVEDDGDDDVDDDDDAQSEDAA